MNKDLLQKIARRCLRGYKKCQKELQAHPTTRVYSIAAEESPFKKVTIHSARRFKYRIGPGQQFIKVVIGTKIISIIIDKQITIRTPEGPVVQEPKTFRVAIKEIRDAEGTVD